MIALQIRIVAGATLQVRMVVARSLECTTAGATLELLVIGVCSDVHIVQQQLHRGVGRIPPHSLAFLGSGSGRVIRDVYLND